MQRPGHGFLDVACAEEAWSDYGDWRGEVLSGNWKADDMAQTLQQLRQEGVAPRV